MDPEEEKKILEDKLEESWRIIADEFLQMSTAGSTGWSTDT